MPLKSGSIAVATLRPLRLLRLLAAMLMGPLQSQRHRHRLRAQLRINDLEDAGTQVKLDAALSKIKALEAELEAKANTTYVDDQDATILAERRERAAATAGNQWQARPPVWCAVRHTTLAPSFAAVSTHCVVFNPDGLKREGVFDLHAVSCSQPPCGA